LANLNPDTDTVIDVLDLNLMRLIAAQMSAQLEPIEFERADINGDGDVTAADKILLERILNKSISSWT